MSSYPKGTKELTSRSSRRRKIRFHGNQFTRDSSSDTSASSKKIASVDSDTIEYNTTHAYRIIEFFSVFNTLSLLVICRKCNQDIKFKESGQRGLGFKIELKCGCREKENINSGPFIHNGFEINRRVVFVFRLLGIGMQGLNLFCNLMDIGGCISETSYNGIVGHIKDSCVKVFQLSAEKAISEEKKENEKRERPLLHIKVSGDGSWKKRGFKSLYGVTTLICYYTGKVIDFIVKSSFCLTCSKKKHEIDMNDYEEWYEEHKEECTKNHEGSSGSMEVESVKEMFVRSEEKFGVKYSDYIGDGDSKKFKAILNINPYGDELTVKKSECVGHVQKRMGTRLRNAQKQHKLGGRGKGTLTQTLIRKLTNYYGLAIRRNIDSVDGMRRDIMATYYHVCSTEEKPQHQYCPTGEESWCFYQKAKAADPHIKKVEHPEAINEKVAQHILPIYKDLSDDNLLIRCLGGHTQNANESFNATIWRLAPKHLNSGKVIVEIATYLAAGLFNDGYSFILHVMNDLDLIVGSQLRSYAFSMDNVHKTRQGRRSLDSSKEGRKARLELRKQQNELYEEAEGLLYGAGIAE